MANSRRSFLTNMLMNSAAVFTIPAAAARTQAQLQSEETMESNQNTILTIKPMGFSWETLDPFLFCVHHEDKFPKGNAQMGPAVPLSGRTLGDDFIIKDGFRMYHGKKVPGFPGHPHRGFETITVVRQGVVDHADSMGASGRYGDGDVQWMTAGKGVQHSEMFPLIHSEKDNPLELFQIWLNLPARNKMVEPHFKMLWGSKIPKFVHTDVAGVPTTTEIIAGTLFGQSAPTPPPNSWAYDKNNEVAIWNIKMAAGATIMLPPASEGVNRCLYVYEGNGISLNQTQVASYHSVQVRANQSLNLQNGNTASSILLLQGKPIKEHVIQYGPFVMNSKEEINQAFADFHQTQFGGWPWNRYDMVHDRNAGRFAKHADGTFEKGV